MHSSTSFLATTSRRLVQRHPSSSAINSGRRMAPVRAGGLLKFLHGRGLRCKRIATEKICFATAERAGATDGGNFAGREDFPIFFRSRAQVCLWVAFSQ